MTHLLLPLTLAYGCGFQEMENVRSGSFRSPTADRMVLVSGRNKRAQNVVSSVGEGDGVINIGNARFSDVNNIEEKNSIFEKNNQEFFSYLNALQEINEIPRAFGIGKMNCGQAAIEMEKALRGDKWKSIWIPKPYLSNPYVLSEKVGLGYGSIEKYTDIGGLKAGLGLRGVIFFNRNLGPDDPSGNIDPGHIINFIEILGVTFFLDAQKGKWYSNLESAMKGQGYINNLFFLLNTLE